MNTVNASQPVGIPFDAADLGTSAGAESPVWLEITSNRDGSPTGMQFEVLGRDSKAWRDLNRHNMNKRFDKMAKTRKLKLTAEEQESEGLELLCATIKNFRSRLYNKVDGQMVALQPEQFVPTIAIRSDTYTFSKDNLKTIFARVPEIREQIEDFQVERVNFVQGSPTT